MTKELISISDRNGRVFGYADQAIFSHTSGISEIFVSAYCYDSSAGLIRPMLDVRPDSDNGIDIDFKKDQFRYRLHNNLTKKQIESKTVRIPGSEMVRIINVIKQNNIVNKKDYGPCKNRVVYFKLKPFLDFYREQTTDADSELENSIYNGANKLKNVMLDYRGFHHEVYKLIKNETDVPFLEEWVGYVLNYGNEAIRIYTPSALYADIDSEENIYAINVFINENRILNAVKAGLQSNQISINGSNISSVSTENITSLTEYLEKFKDQLIEKASSKFTPCYNPESDEFNQKEKDYFDYASYFGKLNFYNTQKTVIAAVNRSLETNRNAFIVGELGCGKTSLAVGSIYCNAKSKHINTIVMAPSHLIFKWQREIERLFPDAKAVVLQDFEDVLNIEKEVTCTLRNYPLFMIISKDSAKINYQERPSAIWDARNHQFLCPNCGSPIMFVGSSIYKEQLKYNNSTSNIDYIRNKVVTPVQFAITAFNSKNNSNAVCLSAPKNLNKAQKHARKTEYDTVKHFNRYFKTCHSSLWTCTTSKENATYYSSEWVKHTDVGWLNTKMFAEFKSWYENLSSESEEKNSKNYIKIYRAIIDIEENGVPQQAQPRRYSIAKYIRKRFKNQIDYLVADEVHLYSSSSSAQANAFGDFVRCAKKSIVLTGTLLNGYADGLYFILYRMYSREFVKRDYPYNSTNAFIEKYGVTKEEVHYRSGRRIKQSSKVCPGVSPQLFVDFLLDKTIFVSLEDMSTGLPTYTEHPVGVELDVCTRENYEVLIRELRDIFLANGGGRDIAFQATQKLAIYPDMPYNVAPLYDKTGQVLLNFNNAVEDPNKFVSNKDLKTLEIVQEKVAKGENVLIYVNFVNKTDVTKRLTEIFKNSGIKSCVLDAKVKATEREKWIDKKIKDGCRVMICNPTLVETGLDLLAFTNIIFYQVGFNLFTMRQAARRSYRLNQPNPVNVYFLYYENTTQETVISLMANKLRAAMAIEGKFTEEGLNSMSNNDSILTQIADSLIKDIKHKVNTEDFAAGICRPEDDDGSRFKLVEMIKEFVKQAPYKLIETKKRPQKGTLQALCA